MVDPFGNVLGVMHNPHYLEILAPERRGQRHDHRDGWARARHALASLRIGSSPVSG